MAIDSSCSTEIPGQDSHDQHRRYQDRQKHCCEGVPKRINSINLSIFVFLCTHCIVLVHLDGARGPDLAAVEKRGVQNQGRYHTFGSKYRAEYHGLGEIERHDKVLNCDADNQPNGQETEIKEKLEHYNRHNVTIKHIKSVISYKYKIVVKDYKHIAHPISCT